MVQNTVELRQAQHVEKIAVVTVVRQHQAPASRQHRRRWRFLRIRLERMIDVPTVSQRRQVPTSGNAKTCRPSRRSTRLLGTTGTVLGRGGSDARCCPATLFNESEAHHLVQQQVQAHFILYGTSLHREPRHSFSMMPAVPQTDKGGSKPLLGKVGAVSTENDWTSDQITSELCTES